jgi:hypothetical protein
VSKLTFFENEVERLRLSKLLFDADSRVANGRTCNGPEAGTSSTVVEQGLVMAEAPEGFLDDALALAFPFDDCRAFNSLIFDGNMLAI